MASKPKKSPYTKPKLRERIKKKILAGAKGGKKGQWSARKAQLLAKEYEKAGGGYTGKRSSGQKSLSTWTKEKWRTSDGKPAIRTNKKGKKVTKRYLPDKAWDELTPAQKAATNRKKVEGSKKGKQVVSNTKSAKAARKRTTSTKKRATSTKRRRK